MPRTSKLLVGFLIFAALGCHKPKPGDPPHSKVGVAVAPPPGQTVNYDPSVVGLGAAIGTTVYDSQGVILWLKYGAPLTSWRAVPVSPLVTGDPSISPGLKAPIGFTVTMNDGSASWVKKTSSDTGWVPNPVSGGGGGIPDGGVAITTADGGGLAGNGTPASPLAVIKGQTGDFFMTYKLRAAALLNTTVSKLTCAEYNPLTGASLWTYSGTAVTLDDNVDAVNAVGGALRQSGSSGSPAVIQVTNLAGRAPTLSYNNSSIKFYRAWRVREITAADSTIDNWMGSLNWHMGALGDLSTSFYSMRVGSTTQKSVISTTPIDTSWHVIEGWWDTAQACIVGDALTTTNTPTCTAATSAWPIQPGILNSYSVIETRGLSGATTYSNDVGQGLWCVQVSP